MSASFFWEETAPEYAHGNIVADGVTRIVANNPGKMTYHGTNSYIVETRLGSYVIDPGPAEDEAHISAIIRAIRNDTVGILVTHHHSDHFGAAPILREETGIPIFVSSVFADDAFEPDGYVEDGQAIGDLKVLHTPGHASDHLCFSRPDGVLFTGDHVMSWNSSIVSLPDGDMRHYCEQLSRLLDREDQIYLPGHGPRIDEPRPYVGRLLENRLRRETEILAHLSSSADTIANIAACVYRKDDPHIARAAERNVEAHLAKLESEARVLRMGDSWSVT